MFVFLLPKNSPLNIMIYYITVKKSFQQFLNLNEELYKLVKNWE